MKLTNAEILIAVSTVFLSASATADIRSATGKPLNDFYTAHGAISAMRATKDICNARHPEFKAANENAYKAWQERYKDFRYKMEQYNEEIKKSVAKGSAEKYAGMLQRDAINYEKTKEQMHDFFLTLGNDGYKKTCQAYPSYTTSEKANFPIYYQEHISIFENYWLKRR
jgi:hypothetical protein